MTHENISDLIAALRSVVPCIAKDNSRYAIAGVLAEPGDDGLRLVATDGHRLALARVPGLKPEGLTKPILLTSAALKALLAKAKRLPEVQLSDAGVQIKTEAGTLQFPPMEGQFPPYRDVIPCQVDPQAVVPPVDLQLLASTTAWSADGIKLLATGSKNRPVLALCPKNPDWLAVLMPIQLPDAGVCTVGDAEAFHQLVGKKLSVVEPTVPTEVPAVAGTVGAPVRQAA